MLPGESPGVQEQQRQDRREHWDALGISGALQRPHPRLSMLPHMRSGCALDRICLYYVSGKLRCGNKQVSSMLFCCLQDAAEPPGGSFASSQSPAAASGGSLAMPVGINPEDIAEGSIRFFHDDMCLSIPFKGEHFMSIDAIKALLPRDLILLYEVSKPAQVCLKAMFYCLEAVL